MASETQDPRVAAMVKALYGWDPTSPPPDDYRAKEELARLDAADPLRKMLPEVVGVLALLAPPVDGVPLRACQCHHCKAARLLTRLQALTTEDPTDD